MFYIRLLAALACACLCAGLPEYRLPGDLVPQHYDLRVLADVDEASNFTFMGTVSILLNVVKETKSITLHSRDLIITEDKIKVANVDKKNIPVVNITYNIPYEFVFIHLGDAVPAGQQIKVTVPFKGYLQESLVGFYRSSYTDIKTGKKIWLATTQFESTYARRAFPCLDEPAMKATFSISLGRHDHFTAISNMPLAKSTPIENMDGWFWDDFEKSVPMSTYLVAYIVSDFKYAEAPKYKNDVLFKIWARADAINQTDYAVHVGPKVLAFYEQYYDVPYPLPKQDMVAIPDFSAGAMENWGIITYRERDLLYSTLTSSTTAKARVGSVIAHELAHQWFGNLVTMKWWTDLWLNEGFATYMATLGLDHVHPDWNVLQEESADNLVDVFKLDALDTSHPVSVPIGDPSEIIQIFDTISYKKGSAIIRMMNLFLGEEVFKTGVSDYLKKYKYKNAEQDDLWQSLTDAGHKAGSLPKEFTVKTIMDSWTKQTGYPLITVARDYSKNTADVSQSRYQNKPSLLKSENQTWWVPLSFYSETPAARNPAPSNWLTGETDKTITGLPSKDKWVLFNVDLSGVYRVNYDDKNWELLSEALRKEDHSKISQLNRFQLITDAMALSSSGKLPYKTSLSLLQYLNMENNYLPWKAGLSSLGYINSILLKCSDYGVLKNYMKKLLAPQFKQIGGFQAKLNDQLETVKQNVQIISWSCSVDIEECKEGASQLFKSWMATENPDINNPIPKDLRSIVYCRGVKEGGDKEWEFLWERYQKADVASVKASILSGMGCTREIWLLNRMLETSITKDSPIRKQDASSAFAVVVGSKVGYFVARDFLYSRVKDIANYHTSQLSTIGRYVKNVASQITTQHEFDEFSRWSAKNKDILKDASLSVKQALESSSITLEWIANHKNTVVQALKELTV